MNKTLFDGYSSYSPTDIPFYHTDRPTLISGIPDNILALIVPIIGYWVLSLFFHVLDISGWQWLDKYRIHESAEVKSRNLATRRQVVWAVLLQQTIQTVLGFVWVTEDVHAGPGSWRGGIEDVGKAVVGVVESVLGKEIGQKMLQFKGLDIVYLLYWWGIPAAQLCLAMFVLDTWQYFLHRLMHVNKFLYKQIHSVHHRLYVPYAFGALYNHPIEGFLLDSLGAVLAESCSSLTARQTILFFTLSTLKTVDDHCGYGFPFDPFQIMSGNNADYHDIHHQVAGIKSNFSQPFFLHWDAILGTRMTRKDIELRRQKGMKLM